MTLLGSWCYMFMKEYITKLSVNRDTRYKVCMCKTRFEYWSIVRVYTVTHKHTHTLEYTIPLLSNVCVLCIKCYKLIYLRITSGLNIDGLIRWIGVTGVVVDDVG